jgi:hypothetical protein
VQWEGERAKRNDLDLDNGAAAVQSRVGAAAAPGGAARAEQVDVRRRAVLADVRVAEKVAMGSSLASPTFGLGSPMRSPVV